MKLFLDDQGVKLALYPDKPRIQQLHSLYEFSE